MSSRGGEGAVKVDGNIITNPEGERIEVVHNAPPLPTHHKQTIIRRPCMYLARFVKSLPVLFISGVVGWSYYAYVVALVVTAMAGNSAEQVICGIIFHVIFLMFVWSYWMVVFTPPGTVPKSWFLSPAAVAELAAAQSEEEWKALLANAAAQMSCPVKQRSVQGAVRYCEKCQCIKPDRSHHCSVCEVCTLKMDHHCPWVNNCVGFANYKYFLLFLCYALLYCTFIACSSIKYFIDFWVDASSLGAAKYHIIFLFLVAILFTISVSSLFWYHVWLTLHNRTTLEQFRAPIFHDNVCDKNGWSLGKVNNLREVLGLTPLLWCLPLPAVLGDGLTFPHCRAQQHTTTYNTIAGNFNSLSRPETPSRTLINPVLSAGGGVATSHTILSNSGAILSSGGPLTPQTPECAASEVRLDSNGHVRTVTVKDGHTAELGST